MEAKDFANIYEEIAVEAGTEAIIKIHKLFKGQQILFPQKLYKKDYIYKRNEKHSEIRCVFLLYLFKLLIFLSYSDILLIH